MQADDRSAGTLFFDVKDQAVKAGEEVVVNFKAAAKVQGYQFTMNLNGLEPMEVVPGANMSTDNFAILNGAVTAVVDADAPEFAVKFRATQAGDLNKMIALTSRITKAAAFNGANEQLDVTIRFNGANGAVLAGDVFEVLQNTPNPVKNETVITFNLPEAAEATLTITNVEGRVVKVINGNYAKGLNKVVVNRGDLQTGVLFYQIATATESATKKMIVVE
jgi:Secretion system C-terminal sorting domain